MAGEQNAHDSSRSRLEESFLHSAAAPWDRIIRTGTNNAMDVWSASAGCEAGKSRKGPGKLYNREMVEEQSADHRDLWLPALVGLLGALVSLAGWGLLVAERQDQLLSAATETAEETGTALVAGFAHQLDSLRGLHELWAGFGLRPPDEWKANVGLRVDEVPGMTSVAWIDVDNPTEHVRVGEIATDEDAALEEYAGQNHSGGPSLVGPERGAAGEIGYRMYLPVETPGGRAGVMAARFKVAPLLDSVFRGRARGYALSVVWEGEEIYSRGIPSSVRSQQWWRIEQTVDLPLEGQWHLEFRPTAEFAAAQLSPLPHYFLAAALLLSAVLAGLAHQTRVVVRQSRFLAASNRALESHGVELEAKVAARTAELEDAVSELKTFNHSVSHDLRSPLGAILNFAAILEEDYQERPLDEDGLAILARIRRSATRATNLLEDLLQLSRAGRAPLTFESIDMGALAGESFAQLLAAQNEKDIEFVVDQLPEVFADRALIGDVFANLFSNALKYSRGREKRQIKVGGRIEGEYCIYEVIDNGQGFDMRFVEKLFGLFERLHTDQEIEGTGVGLAMVARIVKRHGGGVWADGREGEGATFTFSLPRRNQP